MAIIQWDNSSFRLGMDVMDNTHIEFVDLVNAAEQAQGEEFIRRFDALITHTREHFDQENRLMIESGFPAVAEHRHEHARVLGEFERFGQRVRRGQTSFGRSYLRESIAQWFPLHALTMDSALAAHLKAGAPMSDGPAICHDRNPQSG